MRFAYRDLGERPAGSTVVVQMRGSSANVVLLDAVNFGYYRAGAPFVYSAGGLFRTSPVKLPVPHDGRWFVAVDLGGFSGRVKASVEVIEPDGEIGADEENALIEQ